MGERADRVTALPPATKAELEVPKQRQREIEGEIDELRRSLDRNLSELDRRRHEATDWRLQLKRHPQLAAGLGLGALALLGGMVAVSIAKHRREHPKRRAQRIGRALRRGYDHPEKVARPEPNVALKVLAAVATSVGTTLAKKYIEQAWNTKQPAPAARA